MGEAVLVEYGRRQAVGVVLRERDAADGPARPTKPVLARVRSDGPLLTPLQARLAIHVADHYLAPGAMVVRQMLPPGELERIELVATPVEGAAGGAATPPDLALLDRIDGAPDGHPRRRPATGTQPGHDPATAAGTRRRRPDQPRVAAAPDVRGAHARSGGSW